MSCYFHQLTEIFARAGIDVTSSNRKQVDLAIKGLAGNPEQHCPEAWKKIKLEILPDAQKTHDFAGKLRDAVNR